MARAAVIGNLRDLVMQTGLAGGAAAGHVTSHAVTQIQQLCVIHNNNADPRGGGVTVGAQRRRGDRNVAGAARIDMAARRCTTGRCFIVIHLRRARAAPRDRVTVAALAVIGRQRMRRTRTPSQRAVVAGGAVRDCSLQVIKRNYRRPVTRLFGMTGIAQITRAQSHGMFAALALGTN